ncbi:CrcB-like protein-domain-containing protein [Trichophaea hybrida]|nr:CrcB-like protein-domain-containing protein [Trichophaea hybrida]
MPPMALMPPDIENSYPLQHLQNEPSTTAGDNFEPFQPRHSLLSPLPNNPESIDTTTLQCSPPPRHSHTSINRESSPLQYIGSSFSQRKSSDDFPPNLESFDSKPPSATNFLYIHAHLTFFSILGTLARLGLNALTAYPGAPLGSGVIWANFAGCVVMGIFVSDQTQQLFSMDIRALYTGLTTGFCGSFTSFSSFELDTFQFLANVSPVHEWSSTGGNNFMALSAYVIATFALSLGGLQFGAHVASMFPQREKLSFTFPQQWMILPLSAGSWIGTVLMCIFLPHWRDNALFACVFAPLGVYTRFWISRILNPRVKAFPVGTFCCNMFATVVLAGMGVGRARHGGIGCGVMKGLEDGFCGCLSTVSTFAVELKGLRVVQAYVYAVVSTVVGLGVVVGVLGSLTWAKGGLVKMC